jgi:hypothetical protein
MLRHDVVEAIAAGQFSVYPVATIDEGIEILTGVPAGEPADDGSYPVGSVNQRVMARLEEMSEKGRHFAATPASTSPAGAPASSPPPRPDEPPPPGGPPSPPPVGAPPRSARPAKDGGA